MGDLFFVDGIRCFFERMIKVKIDLKMIVVLVNWLLMLYLESCCVIGWNVILIRLLNMIVFMFRLEGFLVLKYMMFLKVIENFLKK